MKKVLRDMFPDLPNHTIESALQVEKNVLDNAIDLILLQQEPDLPFNEIKKSAEEILAEHHKKIRKPGVQYLDFHRMQISPLRQLMRIYKDPKMELTKQLDVNFIGEQGTDMGGPTKEFFHIALTSLSQVDDAYNLQLFSGSEGHLVPLYGVDAVSAGCFEMVGKLVAHSVFHECNGIIGLAEAVKCYIITGSIDQCRDVVSVDDLQDIELQTILKEKIIGKDDVSGMTSSEIDKVEEIMVRHGLTDIPLTNMNKDKAVLDVLVAEIVVTRTHALDMFFKGLNATGIGNLLRQFPELSKFVLPGLSDVIVDLQVIKDNFIVDDDAPMDTSAKKTAHEWFFQFLDESSSIYSEDDGKPLIKKVILFITGRCVVGAMEELHIKFDEGNIQLLQADSCFNRVVLPITHDSYDDFRKACIISVNFGATGYGKF